LPYWLDAELSKRRGKRVPVDVGTELAGFGIGDPRESVLARRFDGWAGCLGKVGAPPGESDNRAGLRRVGRQRADASEVGPVLRHCNDGDLRSWLDLQLGGKVHRCILALARGNLPPIH
jgi:hypothetical protein